MSTNTPEKSDIQAQVNEIVGQFVTADDGSLSLPDGVEVDPVLLHAAKTEKRFRDTQGSYTKGQQEVKRLQKENDLLAAKWEEDAIAKLSASEQAELEELKTQDPEEWHNKLVSMKEAKKAEFKQRREDLSKTVTAEEELAMREQELEMFNAENPDFALTDEVLKNDIPPRLTKQLESGEIAFSDFLDKCKNYLSKGKVIKSGDKPDNITNLNEVNGSREPTEEAKTKASKADYKNEIY